ncbi:MAG: serine acetyltransferase [Pseudomonadota bacterium]
MSEISATIPDRSRERIERYWDPGRKLLRAIRRYQTAHVRGGVLGRLSRRYWVLQHRFWSVVAQADIPLNCQIDGGLMLPHPNGIVLHPDAKIGPNCMIFQQVTLAGPVVLGGHVDIGAGAKLIAPLTVGDHARIGANAVVTRDVPAGCTAVGIPAEIMPRKSGTVSDAAE